MIPKPKVIQIEAISDEAKPEDASQDEKTYFVQKTESIVHHIKTVKTADIKNEENFGFGLRYTIIILVRNGLCHTG